MIYVLALEWNLIGGKVLMTRQGISVQNLLSKQRHILRNNDNFDCNEQLQISLTVGH